MKKYPSIKDDNFYDKIEKMFNRYKIPKDILNADKYCKPRKFKLQGPQTFLPAYINPNSPYKSILIYHRIGAGKTCSAIQIAEMWKNKRKIIFVLPASLKGNFRNELRSQCGGDSYLTQTERKQIEKHEPSDKKYKDIIKKSDERINKFYNIYSYNKFIEQSQEGNINLDNSILIIDEIQNMVSEKGTYYKELYNLIHQSTKNLRVVLLSATPMFDKPVEIALTLNLLNPLPNIPTGKAFDKMFIVERKNKNKTYYSTKNMDKFKDMIKGYVSYYKGAPVYTFPRMSIRYVECEMSTFQYNTYKKILKNEDNGILQQVPSKEQVINASDLPNNFFIGTRFTSNIVYPNKQIGDRGLISLTDKKIQNNLDKYSCKLYKMFKLIRKARGKIFIYSGFKEHAGLKSIIRVLESYGYKNYKQNGIGRKRFAVWSGDETADVKDKIRNIYNKHNNLYGEKLKIILGSPSIKEGVTLKAVRYVHVLEPYWNQSRIEQVIGRASRFCSHISLPEEERNVKVYIYIAIHQDAVITVDQYIKKLSVTKNKIIKEFEKSVKESAIDCRLNINANNIGEENIKCI
jgi:hypothetical protein